MLETIYIFLLHTFALIGLVLTLVIGVTGYVIHRDERLDRLEYEQDNPLMTKTDRELYDAEN